MRNRDSWKEKEQVLLLERLGKLYQNGYSMAEALNMLRIHHDGRRKEDLDLCLTLLKQGEPFHEILNRLEYPKLITGYFYIAEYNGDLGDGLLNGSMMMKIKMKHMEQMKKALRYPLFLIFVLILVLFALNSILLPRFLNLYETVNIELPWMTKHLMNVLAMLPAILLFIAMITTLSSIYFFFFYKRYSPAKKMMITMKIPVVKLFVSLYYTYFFTHQLGLLLKGGLSIFDVLGIFQEQMYLPFFKSEAASLKKGLIEGEAFSSLIRQRHYYEKDFSEVIKHGEANGTLPDHLLQYSELLIQEFEEKLVSVISSLQPVLLLLIAFLLVLLFLSVMQPVFKLINGL